MNDKQTKLSIYKIFFSIIYILLYPVTLFLMSGNVHWIEGWIYTVWFLSSTIIILLYLYFKDPDLLAERFKPFGSKNQKKWDKYLLSLVTIAYFIWFAIMPLDAQRYHWTQNFSLKFEFLGGIALFISSFFMFKSLADNTFTSPLVKMQKYRNQYVVSTGVYGIVRHPMYLGTMLMFIGLPCMLGSIYGIYLGLLLSFLFILRIFGEEKMLIDELDGYKEYMQKVKYRLIPFIW